MSLEPAMRKLPADPQRAGVCDIMQVGDGWNLEKRDPQPPRSVLHRSQARSPSVHALTVPRESDACGGQFHKAVISDYSTVTPGAQNAGATDRLLTPQSA